MQTIISCNTLESQEYNPFIIGKSDELELPFEYVNGLIIIEATLQKKKKVKLLVDTGAENLILFDNSIIPKLGLQPTKSILLKGADLAHDISAQICRNVFLQFSDADAIRRDFLVLDENVLNLNETLGIKIDGLVGGRLFWGTIMEIDYQKQLIKFYSQNAYKPSNSPFVEKLEMEMVNNKPYIKAQKSMYTGSAIPVKLLLDTGSSMGLLIFLHTHPDLSLPENYIEGQIGKGLGGNITGYLAKSKTLRLSKSLFFNNVLTNYQNISECIDPDVYNHRNGILGNPILSKFKVTIDYIEQALYLEAIKNYNKNLSIDKTGIIAFAAGSKLNEYVVKYILPGTPAETMDVRVGDVIKKVGIMSTKLLTLADLNNKFAGKTGKTLRLKLKRNGTTLRKKLLLTDYLKVESSPIESNPLFYNRLLIRSK